MAFFSIIIPTYNSSATIAQCLDSIVAQTFTNFEVLIVDGLSTDDTVAVVQSYNDDRIKILSEKDNGIYDAMNKGITLAKGEWLYFIGSDDNLYSNEVLATVHSNASGDMVYGDVRFKKTGAIYGGVFSLENLLFEKNICHQAIFYKKSIFEMSGNFNTKYRLWADWDFNIRCFKNNLIKISYLPAIIADYNNGEGASGKTEDEILKRELPIGSAQKIAELRDQINYSNQYLKKKKIKAIVKILLGKHLF